MKTQHKRGIKVGAAPRTMLPRVSRHGKPLTDVYTVFVPAVTERKTILNPKTDQYEAVTVEKVKAHYRPMTAAEIADSRDRVLRARGETTSGWRKQAGGK